jgi:hypothetical protein
LSPVIVAVVVVLALAAVLGFFAQRTLHRERLHDDPLARVEGLPISELVIPVRTLATLLLAFVLVAVFQSYQGAADEAAEEAAAVLSMAEDAVSRPGSSGSRRRSRACPRRCGCCSS